VLRLLGSREDSNSAMRRVLARFRTSQTSLPRCRFYPSHSGLEQVAYPLHMAWDSFCFVFDESKALWSGGRRGYHMTRKKEG